VSYLLDTCVISEAFKPNPEYKVIAWLDSVYECELVISVITIGELTKGVAKLGASPKVKRLNEWIDDDLMRRFRGRICAVDTAVSVVWGNLCARAGLEGSPRPVIDSLLAATAAANDLVMVTRNVDDFSHTGVELLNPWEWGGKF
jgi:predicted nucleic acid-binding protein